jgi:hypothetical protein
MPKGGGAVTGMAESFQAAGFTGFAEMSIDFEVTGCRDFAPDLSVDYSSGNGAARISASLVTRIPIHWCARTLERSCRAL